MQHLSSHSLKVLTQTECHNQDFAITVRRIAYWRMKCSVLTCVLLVPFTVLSLVDAGSNITSPNTSNAQTMTLAIAEAAIHAAMDKASSENLKICVAIMDAGANLVTFSRMDGAHIGSIDTAIKKAQSSALFNLKSGELGGYGIELTNGGLATGDGGAPLRNAAGEMIGAIGISGASSAQDLDIAEHVAKWFAENNS